MDTSTDSTSTDENRGMMNDPVSAANVCLVMMGLLFMTYANLILYNTGRMSISATSDAVTFSYAPPIAAMAGAMVLYLLAFGALLSVGSDWSELAAKVGYTTPFVYGVVGVLFLQHIFKNSNVRERAMGGMTDGYVLQVEGAKRLLEGKNPYTYDYSAEILSQVPAYFRTPLSAKATPESVTHAENIVTHLDYPPISALWYLPSQFLGVSGAVQDIVAVMIVVTLLIAMTESKYRIFIPVFFLVDWNLIMFPSAFIPDMGWVIFVVLALFAFHYPRASAICLAFAASYRPQPIIIAPYIGIMAYHHYGISYLKKWIPTGLVATAVINVPFALWSGTATYLEYITIPIRISIPPGGVGPAMLLRYYDLPIETMMAVKPVFTIAVFGAWVSTLIITWRYYDSLGVGVLAFPGLVLWFHWRSLQNYMIWFPMFVGVALLAGLPHRDPVTVLRDHVRTTRLRRIYHQLTTRVHQSTSKLSSDD